MRTLLMAGLVALIALCAAVPARADFLAVTVDVPVVYTFEEDAFQDASVSGIKAGITLPFLLGLGAESYKVTGKVGTITPVEYEYQVTMYDIYVDIPFPVANLVLGGGVGKGEFDLVPATGSFQDANLTQLFFSIGIPFAAVFDAHVGYHKISGEAEVTGGTPVNLDAGMATVGLKIGF